MVERLLLDRIDAEARRAAVGGQHHRVADALAHEARAALALVQLAVARAQVALDAAVVEAVPPAAGEVIAHADACSDGIPSLPFGHRVAGDVHRAVPETGRQARLALERREEFARVGKRLPDLRQERRARRPYSRITPSTPGRSCASKCASSAKASGSRADSTDTSTASPRTPRAREREEARVAERGADGVGLRTSLPQRTDRLEGADAAAQLAVLHQRHERRARLRECLALDAAVAGNPSSAPIASRAMRSNARPRSRSWGAPRLRAPPRYPPSHPAHVGSPCANANARSRRRATCRPRCRPNCAGRAAPRRARGGARKGAGR